MKVPLMAKATFSTKTSWSWSLCVNLIDDDDQLEADHHVGQRWCAMPALAGMMMIESIMMTSFSWSSCFGRWFFITIHDDQLCWSSWWPFCVPKDQRPSWSFDLDFRPTLVAKLGLPQDHQAQAWWSWCSMIDQLQADQSWDLTCKMTSLKLVIL